MLQILKITQKYQKVIFFHSENLTGLLFSKVLSNSSWNSIATKGQKFNSYLESYTILIIFCLFWTNRFSEFWIIRFANCDFCSVSDELISQFYECLFTFWTHGTKTNCVTQSFKTKSTNSDFSGFFQFFFEKWKFRFFQKFNFSCQTELKIGWKRNTKEIIR